ncbi:MAG: hypothetical protein V7703_11795 [Hyphomicrobiales bacterium]
MQIMIAVLFGLPGAFYMFGGFVVVRAIAMDALIDTAIEGIDFTQASSGTSGKIQLKRHFLGALAFVSFAGGAFLFFQSAVAPVLFCMSLAMQLFYIAVLAPKYFDIDEDDDLESTDRRATINAMILYSVVTFCLLLVQHFGLLSAFPPAWSQRETAGLVLTLAFAVYAFRLVQSSSFTSASEPERAMRSDEEIYNGIDGLVELRVQAVEHEEGLWARYQGEEETWRIVDPDEIGLSVALELRISHWEDRYDGFWDTEELNDEPRWSDADKQAHFEEALAIAHLVKSEALSQFPDGIKVTWVNGDGDVLDV